MSAPTTWYTSDPHIGHKLVARERGFVFSDRELEFDARTETYRPVPDTESHDRALAETWDATVRPKDTVFVLGDISISGKAEVLQWFADRPGSIHLIAGNHDPVHPAHRDSFKLQRKWLEVFDSIQPFLRRKLEGHYFLLSHFPYAGTGAEGHGVEDRFTQYRLIDEGMALLHGHVHTEVIEHFSDAGTPEYHVGLDAHDFNLVSQEMIQEWLVRVSA